MNAWIIWASLAMGVAAFAASIAIHRVFQRGSIPRRHQDIQERLMDRLHYRVNLMAEVAHCDEEIWQLREAAPPEQIKLIDNVLQTSHMIPPAMRMIARRFGLGVPAVPVDMVHDNAPPVLVADNERADPPTAWTG